MIFLLIDPESKCQGIASQSMKTTLVSFIEKLFASHITVTIAILSRFLVSDWRKEFREKSLKKSLKIQNHSFNFW